MSRAGLQCEASRLHCGFDRRGKKMQLVTVYIPTKNRSRLLARAVQSVLDQTYPHLEIIIVDDASDDDTEQVVKKLIATNDTSKRIVYSRLDMHSGACAARNAAIGEAKGELITGLDDDDYFLPNRIHELVNAFDPQKHSFIFCGYIQQSILPDGKVARSTVPLASIARFPDLLQRNIVGNQVLTLTERIRVVGGFDEVLPAWQDYDLWIRLVRTFGEGRGTEGATYIRTVGGSIHSISTDLKKIDQAFKLFCLKHPEYEDERLLSCLRLSKACYGIDALKPSDLLNIFLLRKPRLIASSCYFFISNKFFQRTR
jgi:glycosyltransferase involved in cell wall biosynthesis